MEIALENMIIPIKGTISDTMSDKEFFDFCRQNELLRVERDENKQIIIIAPTNTFTGIQNSGLLGELIIWNKKNNNGVC